MNKGDKKAKVVMHEYAAGTLHHGSKTGPIVKDRKVAQAIAMREKRKVQQK
jgi:hypothetical protein